MHPRKEAPMFKLLRSFNSAYQTRSFTKSAEELYFSQPTVSKHIKGLEEMVGEPLFERRGASDLVPTRTGHMVYETTHQILSDWTSLLEAIHRQDNSIPYFSIGVSHSFACLYLPALIDHLGDLYDHEINFDIQVLSSDEIVDALAQQTLDIGFIEKSIRTDMVNYHELCRDDLILAGDLDSDLWLVREGAGGSRDFTEEYMATRHIHDRIMRINTYKTILDLLHAGIGKSIISKSMALDLDCVKLKGVGTRFFYLLEKESDTEGQAFVQAILDYFENPDLQPSFALL